METKTFIVEGMSCSHCEANVSRNLLKINGISEAVADHATSRVTVTGTYVNPEEVENMIRNLGYRYNGIA